MTTPSSPSVALTILPTSDPEWQLWQGDVALTANCQERIITQTRLGRDEHAHLLPEQVHEWMSHDWSFTSSKGKLYKRFVAALHKNTGHEPAIGALILLDQFINDEARAPMFFRVTPKLDWTYREYGDSSCFWGSRDYNRPILAAAGCMALQFRRALARKNNEYQLGAGMGRCWVIPCDGGVGLSNFYGVPRVQQIMVMKDYLGVPLNEEKTGVRAANRHSHAYRNGDGTFLWRADQPRPAGERTAHGPVCACYKEHGRNEPAGDAPICTHCVFGREQPEAQAEPVTESVEA